MRKLIFGVLLSLLATACHATCDSSLTPSYTTNVGLAVPQINSCGWGTTINGDLSIIDSSFTVTAGTYTWSGSNTFKDITATSAIRAKNGATVSFYTSNNNAISYIKNPDTSALSQMILFATDDIGINNSPLPGVGVAIYGDTTNPQYGSFAVVGSSQNLATTYSGFIGTGAVSHSTLWSLPKGDGTSNQSLVTDGSAHLSFSSTLGSSGNSISISSNTILPGATFYAGGVNASVTGFKFVDNSTQTTSGQFGRLVQVKISTSVASTTSSGTAYTVTTTTATINMRNSNDIVKVSVSNCGLQNTTIASNSSTASLFKNSADLSNAGNGLCAINDGGTAITNLRAPCSMLWYDSPGTTNGTSYAVYVKSTAAASTIWNPDANTCIISIEEYTPPNNQ